MKNASTTVEQPVTVLYVNKKELAAVALVSAAVIYTTHHIGRAFQRRWTERHTITRMK